MKARRGARNSVVILTILCVFCFQMMRTDQAVIEGLDEEQYECQDGEVYLECGPECPEACYNLGRPLACGLRCKEGCFCAYGLVRNPDGDCVYPYECPDL